MRPKNNDYAKNARKRIISYFRAQEIMEQERQRRIAEMRRREYEEAEYVEFEEIKDEQDNSLHDN